MPATDRQRIDYQPGAAALEAIAIGEGLRSDLGRQELIDWLVIVGISALTHQQWVQPPLLGRRRDAWRLPPAVRALLRDGPPGKP